MSYHVGVDLGTTYTAAAVWRDGRVEMATLGTRAPAVPSVVYVGPDDVVLTGEAAERRAVTEPQRVAREFKRRLGDPTPMLLGGAPYSVPALTARLLGATVATVVEQQGGPPAGLAVAHPANWGPYKLDLLGEAVRLAGAGNAIFVPEPEAAAVHYAAEERVEPSTVVAVYDLGGGTFDAAVLRRTTDGWELAGPPEGVERLGGVDVDEALFRHVTAQLGAAWDALDPHDPGTVLAATRLRRDCVAAKEALSEDTDVVIPVALAGAQATIRVTRSELEEWVRPALADSVTALERAIAAAGLEPAGVDRVLLVGGASRMPLVAELVSGAVERPVVIDAHPKHGVGAGAARLSARRAAADPPASPPALAAPPSAPVDRPPTLTAAAGRGGHTSLVGLVVGALALVAAAVTAVALAGQGPDGDDTDGGTTTTVPAPSTSATDGSDVIVGQPGYSDPTIAAEVLAREPPDVDPPPADTAADWLERETLIVGRGPAATHGDILTVHAVTVLADGTVADSTWETGEPAGPLTLGRLTLPAWDQGLDGVQAGERRRIVAGPAWAYGSAGADVIPPNAPLAFVIDVVDVTTP